MEKRWIAFFLFTFGLILLFQTRMESRKREEIALRKKALIEQAAKDAEAAQRATSETLRALGKKASDSASAQSAASSSASAAAESGSQSTLRAPTTEEASLPAAATDVLDVAEGPFVEVSTKGSRLDVSKIGALPVRWEIQLASPVELKEGADAAKAKPVGAVNLVPEIRDRHREYPLTIEGSQLEVFNQVPYEASEQALEKGGHEWVFTSGVHQGLRVTRTYRFANGEGYLLEHEVKIENVSDRRKRFDVGGAGLGIGWQGGFLQPEVSDRVHGQVGALVSNDSGLHSERLSLKSEPSTFQGPIRWAGVQKKFFLAALIPQEKPGASVLLSVRERDMTPEYRQKGVDAPLSVVLQSESFDLEPGESRQWSYFIYAGPKKRDLLQKIDRSTGLDRTAVAGLADTIFQGYWRIIRWLGLLLLELLVWFEKLTRNYGVSIILLTILIKIVTYPLTHKSMKIQAKTMAQQAKLKPFIDEINSKYKDNPAARNQALMKLWKEHGVNPFGMLRGCVPVMLQMPIFIALYVLLDQAIELRGQPFLWIQDLSLPDRLLVFSGVTLPFGIAINSLNLLPILMGITQVITSRMSMSAATDPAQRQIMLIMPIAFIFFLYNFPSGLMLYWVVTNAWQIGQQALTNRIIQREQAASAEAPA